MTKFRGEDRVGSAARYQAKLAAPFAVLGVRIEEDWLTDIEYLPLDTHLLAPRTPLAREVCDQLQAYLADPDFVFDLSMHIGGTTHQRRVWRAIQDIPAGKTRSYGDIATELHSAPRAVGQACGANRLDRKSTRLNSSHGYISYAVFCLKKKKKKKIRTICEKKKVW